MRRASFMCFFRLGLCVLVAWAWAPGPARAVLELDITEGIVEPLPIAVTEL